MRDNKIVSICIAAMMLSACSSASANTNEISNTNTEGTSDTITALYITEEYQGNNTEENEDNGNSTDFSGEIGEKSNYLISETEDVSFYVTKHYTTAAEICIENHSDEIVYYGEPFFIEKKIDGEWYSIKPIEQIMWFMILQSIEAGSTLTYETVWDDYYGCLPSGEYRIIKEFNLGDYDSPDEEIYLAAEFTIDPTDETKEFQHIVVSGDEFAETTLSEAADLQ